MSHGVKRWYDAAPEVRAAVEGWLAGPQPGDALRDNPRRRVARLETATGRGLALKQFRLATGRHAMRERWKARLGYTPAVRETRALARAHEAGAPVPPPLGLAELASGDQLLVLGLIDGAPLSDALRTAPAVRHERLRALGRAVAALHAAGLAHGDLHHGNVLVTAAGPVLLDLQRARAATRESRLRDLGFLDHSLRELVSAPDRLRVLRAALGLAARPGPRDRAMLRPALVAAEVRAGEHARSRTRRALRPGRSYGRIELGAERGLRVRELPAEAVAAALHRHRSATAGAGVRLIKDDGRSRVCALHAGGHALVVKEVLARGWRRPLADLLRGSPARRAWRAGHGLRFRGIGAARPLAFVERRRFGLPISSAVLLEDLSADAPADRAALDVPGTYDPGAVVAALGRVALLLHRAGVQHDDLKASHVLLRATAAGPEARLIDLEGVRLDVSLSDARRIVALAQLNASLPDAYPAADRCDAFACYARALPFTRGAARALERVVELSLARRHRWTGAGCARAEERSRTGVRPSGR